MIQNLFWLIISLISKLLIYSHILQYYFLRFEALAITPSHQQYTHDFANGRKNMNGTINNYVYSASHMRPGHHFQKV